MQYPESPPPPPPPPLSKGTDDPECEVLPGIWYCQQLLLLRTKTKNCCMLRNYKKTFFDVLYLMDGTHSPIGEVHFAVASAIVTNISAWRVEGTIFVLGALTLLGRPVARFVCGGGGDLRRVRWTLVPSSITKWPDRVDLLGPVWGSSDPPDPPPPGNGPELYTGP